MKAAEFDYVRPGGLEEACALLADPGREVRILAGGQTLVPLMAMRLVRPDLLVDINEVAELVGINLDGDQVVIGAGTRQAEVERSERVRRHLPLLAAALPWVGHRQTRNRGTIGGSLANADPSAEIPLVAVSLGAEVMLRSQSGTCTLSAAEFLTAPMETAIAAGEIVTELRFPAIEPKGTVGVGFEEINTRASDFAILAAAAQVALDDAGVCTRAAFGLGGATPVPLRANGVEEALLGTRLEDDAVDAAVETIRGHLQHTSDIQASSRYRQRVAPGLLARAIRSARASALRSG